MAPSPTFRIGIDLGGTKTEAIALDLAGREMDRQRVATAKGSYGGTIATIRDLVEGLEARLGAIGTVGIGIPGAISPRTGLIKNANSTWLNGKTFDRDLEEALGRKVRLANDADCFTLSEATDGAGAGFETVFGVILGTGTGGGIVAHGRLLAGPNAIAGEWGHNPLPWPSGDEHPGPLCYCGRRGCIETFLSGPGLARDHGGTMNAEQLAASDSPEAQAALQRYERRLAKALTKAHQHHRPPCHRPGRRPVQAGTAVPLDPKPLGRACLLRPRGYSAEIARSRRFVGSARRRLALAHQGLTQPRHIPI